jgi:hypothetical protein
MVGTFCVLWRNQPAKLAAFCAFFPSFLLAGFTDALPEAFRVPVSRVFFTLDLLCLLILLAGIAFNRLGLEDFDVDLSLRTVKISSVAAGALTSLLPFAARNLGMILLRPGVLPIIQSSVASVKLSSRALLVAKAMHTFSVLQVAHANKMMARAERSISYRSSRHFSAVASRARSDLSRPAHPDDEVPEEDEEPLDESTAGATQARAAAFDMPIPAISEVSLEALVETLVKILRAMDTEFSSVLATLLSIPGIESLQFRRIKAQIRRCGDTSVKLAIIGMDVVTTTNFAVDQAKLRRCLVSSRRPAEVRTAGSLIPAVSRVFLKSKPVQALSNALWALSAIPTFMVIYDVRPDYRWLLAVSALSSFPGVFFVFSCLNQKLVKSLIPRSNQRRAHRSNLCIFSSGSWSCSAAWLHCGETIRRRSLRLDFGYQAS